MSKKKKILFLINPKSGVQNKKRVPEMIEKYTKLNNSLELKKHEILSAARQSAKQIIADANKKIEHTIAEIKTAQAKKEETQAARRNLQQEVVKIEAEQKTCDEKVAKIKKTNKQKLQYG